MCYRWGSVHPSKEATQRGCVCMVVCKRERDRQIDRFGVSKALLPILRLTRWNQKCELQIENAKDTLWEKNLISDGEVHWMQATLLCAYLHKLCLVGFLFCNDLFCFSKYDRDLIPLYLCLCREKYLILEREVHWMPATLLCAHLHKLFLFIFF